MNTILNKFERMVAAGIIGAIIFLVLVEVGLFSVVGIPSAANVLGDLATGFIASASTVIIFKFAENKIR